MGGSAQVLSQLFFAWINRAQQGSPMKYLTVFQGGLLAISLAIATHNLLASQPTIDHVLVMQILNDWSTEIGPLAEKLEKAETPKRRKRGDSKS